MNVGLEIMVGRIMSAIFKIHTVLVLLQGEQVKPPLVEILVVQRAHQYDLDYDCVDVILKVDRLLQLSDNQSQSQQCYVGEGSVSKVTEYHNETVDTHLVLPKQVCVLHLVLALVQLKEHDEMVHHQ